MPKKIKLSNLKIKSFVTSLNNALTINVKGGLNTRVPGICEGSTNPRICPLTDLECSVTCGCPTGTCNTCATNCGTCVTECGTCGCTTDLSTQSNPPNCQTYDCTIGYCC